MLWSATAMLKEHELSPRAKLHKKIQQRHAPVQLLKLWECFSMLAQAPELICKARIAQLVVALLLGWSKRSDRIGTRVGGTMVLPSLTRSSSLLPFDFTMGAIGKTHQEP